MKEIPEKIDLLIIGAGIIGSSVFYWLKEKNYDERVLIIDKNSYGTGNSSKAAGIMTIQLPHETDSILVKESQEFYSKYGGVSGGIENPKYVVTGFLTTAKSETRREYLEKQFLKWKKIKPDTALLTPKEVKELSPAINEKEVSVGVYTPSDGFGSGNDWSNWFIRRTRDDQFLSKAYVEANEFNFKSDEIIVKTNAGEIITNQVLVTAGAWSKQVLNKMGLWLPLKSYRAKAISIDPFPGSETLIPHHDIESGTYFKKEVNKSVVVGDGTEHVETPPDQEQRQPPLDFLEKISETLLKFYPSSEVAGVKSFWSGHCQATPDTFPILGNHPLNEKIMVAVGFQGIGVMRAAAIGKIMAEFIISEKKVKSLPKQYWFDRFNEPITDFKIKEGFQT